MLDETCETAEAKHWRRHAVRCYDVLVDRHPWAFADHAADFWLGAGRDPPWALNLATQNLARRPTPRARTLLRRALAAKDHHERMTPSHYQRDAAPLLRPGAGHA
jgi:hypothetical protein